MSQATRSNTTIPTRRALLAGAPAAATAALAQPTCRTPTSSLPAHLLSDVDGTEVGQSWMSRSAALYLIICSREKYPRRLLISHDVSDRVRASSASPADKNRTRAWVAYDKCVPGGAGNREPNSRASCLWHKTSMSARNTR
jgi:hypothetical protein